MFAARRDDACRGGGGIGGKGRGGEESDECVYVEWFDEWPSRQATSVILLAVPAELGPGIY